jgi:DNA-binding beta-propeller fold protein YncE
MSSTPSTNHRPADAAISVGGVGAFLTAIAVTPGGKTAYVSNQGSGTITPIQIARNTSGPPISPGTNPSDIAITP